MFKAMSLNEELLPNIKNAIAFFSFWGGGGLITYIKTTKNSQQYTSH